MHDHLEALQVQVVFYIGVIVNTIVVLKFDLKMLCTFSEPCHLLCGQDNLCD